MHTETKYLQIFDIFIKINNTTFSKIFRCQLEINIDKIIQKQTLKKLIINNEVTNLTK